MSSSAISSGRALAAPDDAFDEALTCDTTELALDATEFDRDLGADRISRRDLTCGGFTFETCGLSSSESEESEEEEEPEDSAAAFAALAFFRAFLSFFEDFLLFLEDFFSFFDFFRVFSSSDELELELEEVLRFLLLAYVLAIP